MALVAPGAGAVSGPPASYGRRVGAWAVDCVIVYGVALVVAVILILIYSPNGHLSASGQTGVGFLLGMTVPLYSALLHRFWHRQTIGKRCFEIAVRRMDGTESRCGDSRGRSAARRRVGAPIPLWPLGRSDGRSRHDLAAGTVVVQQLHAGAEAPEKTT